jgi:hypothetical protein
VVLLAVGGAIAALALTTATPKKYPRAVAATRDVLPVFADEGASSSVEFFSSTSRHVRPLAQSLAVFKEPARPSDALPARERDVFVASPQITPEPNRARLLITAGPVRIFAYPTKQGLVCYFLEPAGSGGCAPDLLDGALPQVERGEVWGLIDDGAEAVDVRVPASGWLRAAIGRNAFYIRLPRNVLAPSEIVVRERNGVRHVYAIKRCHAGDVSPLAGASPLRPPPC